MHLTLLQLLDFSLLVIRLSSCEQSAFTEASEISSHPQPFTQSADVEKVGLKTSIVGRVKDYINGLADVTHHLHKRAPTSLDADTPITQGLKSGDAPLYFTLPASIGPRNEAGTINEDVDVVAGAELRKRQDGSPRTVFVTINTCQQPDFGNQAQKQVPPQLTLSLSAREPPSQPNGPNDFGAGGTIEPLDQGFAALNLTTDRDVYIGVQAPEADATGGTWTFEVAASVIMPYHSWINQTDMMLSIDSDAGASLLITESFNMTAPNWSGGEPPFSVFVQNINDMAANGMNHSYCGLKTYATVPGPDPDPAIVNSISHYFFNSTEQQIYVPKLNASSTYYGYLAKPDNINTPGGGGTVYSNMTFSTKRYSNCRVIYGLDFCDTVAYAAPSNPDTFGEDDMSALATLYDEDARKKYKNFDYSLQQIACNTTPTAQYSLAKTCDDCATAYRRWLCAVTIPRCADWTPDPSNAVEPYLQPRNAAQKPLDDSGIVVPTNDTLTSWFATNSSRNDALINEKINPGPYSEVLPCKDLCHELVRSCPAALQFSCPTSYVGLNGSYGNPVPSPDGCVSCSEPGAVCGRNGGGRLLLEGWLWAVMLIPFFLAF